MGDTDQAAPAGMRRRDLLKKGAVAGGIVWVAPLVTSSPAFAAGTLASDLCICPDGKSTDRIDTLTFEWNAGDCIEETQPPRCSGPMGETNTVACMGDSTGVAQVTVTAGSASVSMGVCTVNSATYPVAPNVVLDGGQFTVDLPNTGSVANTGIVLTWIDGGGVTRTQTICMHTSCSQPICFTDEYGPLTLVSYTVQGHCA